MELRAGIETRDCEKRIAEIIARKKRLSGQNGLTRHRSERRKTPDFRRTFRAIAYDREFTPAQRMSSGCRTRYVTASIQASRAGAALDAVSCFSKSAIRQKHDTPTTSETASIAYEARLYSIVIMRASVGVAARCGDFQAGLSATGAGI